ncbi:MAG: hypothetical protein EBZ84_05070 [Betaproteobacteria bacterium]|nr:hypothetical protein [Betaproteobacteria bacterium]
MLRGFFPSWHFFDRIGHRPLLQIRALQGDADWSRWQSFQPRSRLIHGLWACLPRHRMAAHNTSP